MMPSAEARVVSSDELYLSGSTATRQPGKPATNTSAAGVLTACLGGRRVRFGSRWAIHPAAQVPVINQAFMPTPEQVEAARRLVERYDGALDQGVGVCVDEDGNMVDEAVARAARRILARARRTAEKSGLL